MNPFVIHQRGVWVASGGTPVPPTACGRVLGMGALLLVLAATAGCGAKPAAPAATVKPKVEAPKTTAVVTQKDSTEFVSVFEDDLLPPKGRDPFYPTSTRRNPAPPVTAVTVTHVDPVFVLKAVIHTSKHSQAVINNSFLEVGEPYESVRFPGGHAMMRCLEVGDDYVIYQVEGEQPKKLPMEKKKN